MSAATVFRLLRLDIGSTAAPFAVLVERGSEGASRLVGDLDGIDETERRTWIADFLDGLSLPSDRAALLENWRDWLMDYNVASPTDRDRMRSRLLGHTPGLLIDPAKAIRFKGSVGQIAGRLLRQHLHDAFDLRVSDLLHQTAFSTDYSIRRRCEIDFSDGQRLFAQYTLERTIHADAGPWSNFGLSVPEPDNLPDLPNWVTRNRKPPQLILVRTARALDEMKSHWRELRAVTMQDPRIRAVLLTHDQDREYAKRLRAEGLFLIPAMDQHAGSRLLRALMGL